MRLSRRPPVVESAPGGLGSAARVGPGAGRFPAFDGFRAIAASSVLLLHAAIGSGFLYRRTSVAGYFFYLDVGVCIFFVISGFLLYRPFVLAHLDDRGGPALLPYARRRLLRIFPAYWAAVTVITYVLHQEEIHSVREFVMVYGLLQIYDDGFRFSGLNQAWSLCTELSFYLFLPIYAIALRRMASGVAVHLRARRELLMVGVLVVVGFSSRFLLVSWRGEDSYSLTTLPVYLHLFGCGMGLAVLSAWQSVRSDEPLLPTLGRRPWAWWLLAAAAYWAVVNFAGFDFKYLPSSAGQWVFRDLMMAIVATALLVPGVFGRQDRGAIRRFLNLRAVQVVGLVSYGIYLWHEAAIELVQDAFDQPMFTGAFPQVLIAATVLSLVLAGASYLIVEKPALRLKDGRSRRRVPASEPVHV
jgi:peptidoglycan/LPS O-acetylase OafA/YrhL